MVKTNYNFATWLRGAGKAVRTDTLLGAGLYDSHSDVDGIGYVHS